MLTVYSKEQCAKCNQAKLLLDIKGIEYTTKMLGVDFSREELIGIAPKAREFPVVFSDTGIVGGLAELKAYLKA